MKISVIICAAGDGNRLNNASRTPKQYLVINGKTIIEYSIDKFLELDIIENIVIAINPSHIEYTHDIIKKDAYKDKVIIIHGSDTRLKSVMRGLEYLSTSGTTHVFIHDAARPNFSSTLPNNLIKAAKGHDGSIPIIEASSTIKQLKNEKLKTLDRSTIIESQTPQFFDFMAIYNSYKSLAKLTTGVNHVTDDAQVAELAGLRVNTFKDNKKNYKIWDDKNKKLYKKLRPKNFEKVLSETNYIVLSPGVSLKKSKNREQLTKYKEKIITDIDLIFLLKKFFLHIFNVVA